MPTRVGEYGATGALSTSWLTDPTSATGAPLAQSNGTTASWLLTDWAQNITAAVATTATAVTGTKTLDAFGNTRNAATGSLATAAFGFSGQYLDSITSLYDMRARDYDPTTGRFTAEDPAAIATGMPYYASYLYGYANPLVFTDPTGMWGWSNVTKFWNDHQEEIKAAVVGVAVGVLVTSVCTGLTFGVGATGGCEALGAIAGGAAAGLMLYETTTPATSRTALGAVEATASGAVYGFALAGVASGASSAFKAVAGSIFGRGGAATADGAECALAGDAATAGLSPKVLALSEAHITDSGTTVLGRFPEYISNADARGASYFDIGDDAWNSLSPAQRTAANHHFLDVIASKGDRVNVTTPKSKIGSGGSPGRNCLPDGAEGVRLGQSVVTAATPLGGRLGRRIARRT